MTNLRIYVGTYGKYNNGSLFGEWLEISKFSNLQEFYRYISELHKDENDPEFMFQDWECSGIIEKMGLVGKATYLKTSMKS
jgi:antirestriction protein